jgi:hypothetical protein
MPITVYTVGVVFGTEKLTLGTTGNLVVVAIGILIASYGGWLPPAGAAPEQRAAAAAAPARAHMPGRYQCCRQLWQRPAQGVR